MATVATVVMTTEGEVEVAEEGIDTESEFLFLIIRSETEINGEMRALLLTLSGERTRECLALN